MTPSAPASPGGSTRRVALAVHDRQLAEHGGSGGIRDAGFAGIPRSPVRPAFRRAASYDRAALAAAFALEIAATTRSSTATSTPPGSSRRIALALDQEPALAFTPEDAIAAMQSLAAGELSEEAMADWFRERVKG